MDHKLGSKRTVQILLWRLPGKDLRLVAYFQFSLGIFRGPFRRTGGPRSFLGNSFPRNSVGNFRGISEEK
ncbi:hypothetical protein DY000_02038925 [Brassica cretica]|uniref:Uncharacterized protein n=1 Tax=Brassica cretica TaxID=69181 RepID=A0ABQ7BFZ8_BRACR|nr:hypothetical protein DY000_02038925 [Brassica cretica]